MIVIAGNTYRVLENTSDKNTDKIVLLSDKGNKEYQRAVQNIADYLKEQGYHYLLGTAHPDNVASVNTFLKLQYEQVMTKEKYGGMKRSIFCKAI